MASRKFDVAQTRRKVKFLREFFVEFQFAKHGLANKMIEHVNMLNKI